MENLAPAGNRAALERAEAAGADAVYLGYAAFSARAGAGNFNRQELEKAIRFAHARGIRVYVTLNTLVKDREIPEVAELIQMLWSLKADALLVQDLGVLRILRNAFPGLQVHASTQMAIHNRTGAAWCRRQGMRRVVLARECPLSEIRQCAEEAIEIEVFAHGAQCVSVSGLCLFSSMVGERSGNRGRCAQPCRREYLYRGQTGAWLSPRDICLRDDLDRLQEAGVDSVKLEGRAKRPEYTEVVTSVYHTGLSQLREACFRKASEDEREALLQIFNRGGFMRGYAFGCEDANVIWPETVNHIGVPIGRVEKREGNLVRVRLDRELHDGDELEIRHGQRRESFLYAGKEASAGTSVPVRPRPGIQAAPGDQVARLTDAKQIWKANAHEGRKIPVSLTLRAMPGETLTLAVTDGESRVTVTGETVAAARTRPMEKEEMVRCLCRTGETFFISVHTEVETENAFVPLSELNRLRREALEQLEEERVKRFTPDCGKAGKIPPAELPRCWLPDMVTVRTEEQAEAARGKGFRMIWYPEDYREEAMRNLLERMQEGAWLRLPEVCEEKTLQMLRRLVGEYRDKLGGIVLGTAGQLGIPWPVPFGAGSGIPVMNRQAAALLAAEGCAFVTASQELTGKELAALTAEGAPISVCVYGRTQLMLLHHCSARTALGLTKGHAGCRMCDEDAPEALKGNMLEDRMGHRFPLLRQRLPEGCLIRLMNERPVDWLEKGNLFFRQAELTTENREETEKVIAAMVERRKSGVPATLGHWNRAVE